MPPYSNAFGEASISSLPFRLTNIASGRNGLQAKDIRLIESSSGFVSLFPFFGRAITIHLQKTVLSINLTVENQVF